MKAIIEKEKEEIKKYRKSLEFKANKVRSGSKAQPVRKSAWVD
jgi:Targeting protein for Xklp2 (TPX2) domain